MARRLADNVLIDGVWIGRGTLADEMDQDLVGRIADYCWVDDDGAVPPTQELPDASPPADPVSGAATLEPPPPVDPTKVPAGTGAGDSDSPESAIPPKGGPGSGKDVWAAYARQHNVTIEPGASREDIWDALDEAKVPTEAKPTE